MLTRAAFVSVFLHLLILLVQNPLAQGSWLPTTEPPGRPLYLVLTPLSGSHVSVDAEQVRARAPAAKAVRRQPSASLAAKGAQSRSAMDVSASIARPPPTSGDLPTSQAPPSAELVRQYRLSLARSARPLKAYPPLAQSNGWEGTVVVTVMQTASPGPPRIALEKSSGHALLDRQALEMVEKAVSQAVLPEGLRGQVMSLSLAVVYSTQND